MGSVGKLAEAELSGVEQAARAKTYWPALSWRAIPEFAMRCFAVIVALASVAAVAMVGVFSFGLYGVAEILGEARPLRSAYEFLSHAYDRFIERLAGKVLRDPRDAPGLRLMVSITLTALPVFVAQLILGKPRLLLVIAFYLFLYGLKFQRFVRMFSAKHLEAHRPQSYFADGYAKVFGRYVEFFLGYLYGNVPELDRTVHVRLHHRENGGPDDTVTSSGYDRTKPVHFLWYLADNIWTALGFAPFAYFRSRGDEKLARRMLWGMARFYIFFAAIFIYNWRIGIWFALIPFLVMNFIMAMTAWVQHAFCDAEHPEDYFANTVTVYDEVNFMNEGYHLCHHHRSGLHWTEMPAHLERIRDKMRESHSLVFRDLDFMELFIELTLLRRMDVLAEKLETWEPMSHQAKRELLESRTKPARMVVA